ncbi:MAG TPA: ABC transporter permease subunit [Azospirillum sp.]|nr:ABC transporter permease subunit [Azospirillum sp.]
MTRIGWIRLGVVVGAVLLLEVLCRTGVIDPQTVIAPSAMAVALFDLLRSGEMNADIASTLTNVAIAFVAAVVGGFAIGVGLHAVPPLRRAADPLLATYYAIPFFVFYPVLIALFGMNDLPIIVIGFLFAVVAMVINTLNGLDRIPPVLLKTARLMHMGPLNTALRVKLPSAAPYLFTGVKLAVAYAFIGVIAAEFILSTSGLGYSIAYAYNNFDNARMYALMLFIIILVTAVNMAFYVWEQNQMQRRRRPS